MSENKESEAPNQPTEEQLDKEIQALSKKLHDLYAQKWQSEMKKYEEWKQKQQPQKQNNDNSNDNKDNNNDNKENQQNNPYFRWFQWFEKHMPPNGHFEGGNRGPHQHPHHPPNHQHPHKGGEHKFGPPPHFNPFFMWMQWQQQQQPNDQKDWCPYDGRRGKIHGQGQKNPNKQPNQKV